MTDVPKLTKEQAAIIGAYTGIICGPFGDVQEYVDSLPGFAGIMTHHFANGSIAERIKDAARNDFLALCYGRS